jgi:ubiquinol oxidase|tara:strand:- start:1000 stop:1647 length:648 start_codon:yes stop_codon:yes gene_type:complete
MLSRDELPNSFDLNSNQRTQVHLQPECISDSAALFITRSLRFFADTFFRKRYGHRAVVLETIAAVPGMVGGMLAHFKSLRKMIDDGDFIKELLEEADNERMHLMTFIAIAKPSAFERFIIMAGQFLFGAFYTILYIFFKRTAHRMVGYFEEEAVFSYTEYLNEIDSGKIPNTPAPEVAINYWGLDKSASLREVIEVIRDDEAGHRDRNHAIADSF